MTARFAFCLILSWLTVAASARADDGSDTFRAVIAAQVEAFRRDDWAAAFGYASPGIRAELQDADAFRRMVMPGYRPVARPRIFEFKAATGRPESVRMYPGAAAVAEPPPTAL